MSRVRMDDALVIWRRGNDAGLGYAPYCDVPGDTTTESAVDAAVEDGAEVVISACNTSEITVLRMADGSLVGIGGDAVGSEAWAVDISEIELDGAS